MKRVLTILKIVFKYYQLYIGRGNSGKLKFKPGKNIKNYH